MESYIFIRKYRALDFKTDDTTTFSDLYTFGFGQSFYSRALGYGRRMFLNPYTGYSVGSVLASSKLEKSFVLYLAPSLGLELLKTRSVIIDTRADYFLPLDKDKIEYLRGFNFSVSANFIF